MACDSAAPLDDRFDGGSPRDSADIVVVADVMDGGRFDLVSAGEGGGRFRSLAIPFGRDVAVVDEGGGFTDDDGGADVSAAGASQLARSALTLVFGGVGRERVGAPLGGVGSGCEPFGGLGSARP